jgi:hypothetical protein
VVFAALLEQYSAEDVLIFLTAQRLVGGYDPDSAAVAEAYPEFFTDYSHANGIPRRDEWLLKSIHQGLQEHDRVVVIFGGWHVLALKPVFGNILQQATESTRVSQNGAK